MRLKESIDLFYIDKIDDIYWINEDVLAEISCENDFYRSNVYFYLLNLYYLYLDKNKYKEVAYLSYLISYYLFVIETPFGSEFISKKYAEYAIKYDDSKQYREWLKYVNQGN